jgi:hypothetical protein
VLQKSKQRVINSTLKQGMKSGAPEELTESYAELALLGNSSDHHVMFVGKGGSNGLGF